MYPQVVKKQIKYNTSKRTKTIKKIIIHYTGNLDKGSNPEMHYKYFNSGNKNSSADFFVDDKSIWQINDYTKYYTWAVGDGSRIPGQTIFNSNSVSVEICVNSESSLPIAIENAIYVIQLLMKELNISAENVCRHYDVSRKQCPKFFIDMNIKGYNDSYSYFRKRINEPLPKIKNNKTIESWKIKEYDKAFKNKIITDTAWKNKLNESCPTWAVLAMFNNLIDKNGNK